MEENKNQLLTVSHKTAIHKGRRSVVFKDRISYQ